MKRTPSISLVTIALGLLSGAFGDDPGPTLEDATYDPVVRAEFEEAISFSLNPDADVEAQFSDSCVLTQPKECIKTASEFEKKLQDYTTLELILCDGFKYNAKLAFDLSFRTKKVKCAGKCYIKGYHFTPKANSWITVTKAGHQEWCGVTFDDFQGDGVRKLNSATRKVWGACCLTRISLSFYISLLVYNTDRQRVLESSNWKVTKSL
jgi:hypothetical protein